MKTLRSAICVVLLLCAGSALVIAGSWTQLANPAPQAVGPLLQLRDGRILAHSDQLGNANVWYILTPSITGSYVAGTWSGPYAMQAGYSPFFFSSAVLLDGKTIIIEGGEYNLNVAVWTNLGAIGTLTPFGGITFTANPPPPGWTTIGDAQSVVLENGKYLQANCCTKQTAIFFNPGWTPTANVLAQRNEESAYTALPDGRVLMVDVQANTNCGNSTKSSEFYSYSTDTWTCGPQVPIQLWQQSDQDLGAAVLFFAGGTHPLGAVMQFGGNVVATAVFDIASNTWSIGPTPPNGLNQADGPAALEPNGLVLAMLSPGLFNSGCQFVEYDPITNILATIVNSPQCPADSSYEGHLMILPTGQIASVSFDTQIYVYDPSPPVYPGVQPSITSFPSSVCKGTVITCLSGGKNYQVCGTQLNGLSETNAYGDDYQAATNYPLIRFTDPNTLNVYYAWTHGDTNHSIAPGNPSCTLYDLPPIIPVTGTGITYNMEVVVNGIASNPPVQVTIFP